MSVYDGTYTVYERLASSKMNAMVTAINAHTHDGTYGSKISFANLTNVTITATQIPADLITSAMIAANSITTTHILNDTITIDDINTTSIHLDASTGYAVYSP